jgi:hypothetical protein
VDKILPKIWSRDTAHPSYRDVWSENNKSAGQCCVTALLVQEIYGGKIFECFVNNKRHFYNEINGEIRDYTIDQFDGPVVYERIRERKRNTLFKSIDVHSRYNALYYAYTQIIGDSI